MSAISDDVVEVVREAISLEINGRSFFEHAEESTSNELAKKMFQKLANDEIGHLKAFGELFTSVIGSSDWKKYVDEEEAKKSDIIEELKGRMNKQKDSSASELEALRIGMELERKAITFFQKAAEDTDDDNALEIFKRIAEEEKTHYDLLQAQYDSVTGAGFWFDISEFRMDGMY